MFKKNKNKNINVNKKCLAVLIKFLSKKKKIQNVNYLKPFSLRYLNN